MLYELARRFPDTTRTGRVLRAPLHLVRHRSAPILTGPARGLRWRTGVGHLHAYWIGNYERPLQDSIAQTLRPGDACWDLGAHVGFLTTLMARCVGPDGEVVAVEPSPENLTHLQTALADNGFLPRARLYRAVVSDRDGLDTLALSSQDSRHRLHTEGIPVRSFTLDILLSECARPPRAIKMDVERAELRVLQHGRTLLAQHHPLLWLSVHTDQLRADCTALLQSHGYTVRDFMDDMVIAT